MVVRQTDFGALVEDLVASSAMAVGPVAVEEDETGLPALAPLVVASTLGWHQLPRLGVVA